MEQFGFGQPVRRREDARFLTGAGQYTDDMNLDGQAYAYILRSPSAHAKIARLDVGQAEAMPGVLAILTYDDVVADGLGPIPCQVDVPGKDGAKMFAPPRPVLANGTVRYVGDPVAVVVAQSQVQARDAAEAIEVDYEELAAVADTAEANRSGAPRVWPERDDNLCVHWESHDSAPVDEAFARANRTVRLELINNRVVGSPMEPRVALADYDAETDTRTLYSPTQGVVRVQEGLADLTFKIPKEKMRVVSRDVGGGFGIRGKLFPESIITVWAAWRLRRPVKWSADRSETFLADCHGRDHVSVVEMAFDADAKILAMRAQTVANMGAYLSDFGPRIATVAGARIAGTVYDVPVLQHSVRCVFTNTVPTDAYRGAGRPEMCYQMERLLDLGADSFAIGREEIRRRNFISPASLPYTNCVGMEIDSGQFAQTMDKALEQADWSSFESRRASALERGRLRGIGLGYYIEASGGQPTEEARVRFEDDGKLSVIVGTFSHGQGHETAFLQILNEKLGINFDQVNFMQGDTDFVKYGLGTGGSRSSQMGGVAVARASDQIIDKARKIAAHVLEAAEADVEFAAGRYSVAGTDLSISLDEVVKFALAGTAPEDLDVTLDETCRYQRSTECNFPNGCHVCEVEIDPDTGKVDVVAYSAVDDCGRIINPMLVAGQVHGGVAMGLGQALLEHTAYDDESAQLLSATYMDYCLPRADDFPAMAVSFNEVVNPRNELGVKGAGEGGACGAPPAIIGAIADALHDYGVQHVDMPVSSEDIWRVMNTVS
ncbi:MAG: xanthine dehydrogenase family protein molybdopterin-binding subunit [Gammaproteobacteria bacterium]|nr:xanthine dehydrogenase family protein molybdopterin-binding subunit [Gammaproteobacteria bacterium]